MWKGPSFTAVTIPEPPFRINYRDGIFLIGSCFTENMGSRLKRYKYSVCENPFGILYNPVSMGVALRRIAQNKHYQAEELVRQGELWHSMDHHGAFSHVDPEVVIAGINHQLESARDFLRLCTVAFISLGTSTVFRYTPTNHIAGNCHKIPQDAFEQSRLSVSESAEAFNRIREDLMTLNPAIRIIFTVSPVRHVRQGLTENLRSKSVLVLAIEQMTEQYDNCFYFPAYELMTDQLRDYRYYARDLIHPSAEAIDVLWDTFSTTFLQEADRTWHAAMDSVRAAMEHRFLHDRLSARILFAEKNLQQIHALEDWRPELSWLTEKAYFEHLLKN